MQIVEECLNFLQHWVQGFGQREWAIVAVLMLAVGMMCFRGFGSRRDY